MIFPSPHTRAESFYRVLSARGIELTATGTGNLRFTPKSALSAGEVELLKEYKGELLQLLRTVENRNVLSPLYPLSPPGPEPDMYGEYYEDSSGDSAVPTFVTERLERASKLGLVARWSSEFGYISIHDPTSGEWYDLETEDAPAWAKSEAFKRKYLRKFHGVTQLLNQAEIEEIWREEHATAEEGIVEDNPVEEGERSGV